VRARRRRFRSWKPRNRYRGSIARLRASRGGRCECTGCVGCLDRSGERRCARDRRLEFAHLRPTGLRGRGRGRAERYHDILRNPDAYSLRCWWCHLELDRDVTRARASVRLDEMEGAA
jgi:hypothetical protein